MWKAEAYGDTAAGQEYVFQPGKELVRKVAEVLVAFDLERNYSKNEILELYVNTIYYGETDITV